MAEPTFLIRRIAATGPITLAEYMAEALFHPEAGYYTTRDPLGRAGDFTTAPEISQVFGELIGAWLADGWDRLGRPAPVTLVELGPGRGTLMADALRVLARPAGLAPALSLHLVEASSVLRDRQAEALAATHRSGIAPPTWHHALATVPDTGPMLLVANEFLDALPIRQFERTDGGWRERMVGLAPDGANLAFALGPPLPALPPSLVDAAERCAPGDVLEARPSAEALMGEIVGRLSRTGAAALFVDYGHDETRPGNTFQAVDAHRATDPLAAPSRADLTAHVDFGAIARAVTSAGGRVQGPIGQGDFLRALGIEARFEALARANPARAGDLATALTRLVGPDHMGVLFRVLAVTGARGPDLAALPPAPPSAPLAARPTDRP